MIHYFPMGYFYNEKNEKIIRFRESFSDNYVDFPEKLISSYPGEKLEKDTYSYRFTTIRRNNASYRMVDEFFFLKDSISPIISTDIKHNHIDINCDGIIFHRILEKNIDKDKVKEGLLFISEYIYRELLEFYNVGNVEGFRVYSNGEVEVYLESPHMSEEYVEKMEKQIKDKKGVLTCEFISNAFYVRFDSLKFSYSGEKESFYESYKFLLNEENIVYRPPEEFNLDSVVRNKDFSGFVCEYHNYDYLYYRIFCNEKTGEIYKLMGYIPQKYIDYEILVNFIKEILKNSGVLNAISTDSNIIPLISHGDKSYSFKLRIPIDYELLGFEKEEIKKYIVEEFFEETIKYEEIKNEFIFPRDNFVDISGNIYY